VKLDIDKLCDVLMTSVIPGVLFGLLLLVFVSGFLIGVFKAIVSVVS